MSNVATAVEAKQEFPYFTEEHDMIRQTVKRFCREEIAPYAEEWDLAFIEKILAAHRSLKGQHRRRGDWPRWLRRKSSCLRYAAYERFCWTTRLRWLDRPRRLDGTAHRHDDPGEHTLPSFYGGGRSRTRDRRAITVDGPYS